MSDELKVATRERRVPVVAIIVIAVVLVGGGLAALLVTGGGGGGTDGASERVKIEIRAKPVATITFRGRDLGRTPLTIHVPRSSTPETLEATFTLHKMNMSTRDTLTEKKTQTKTFVPDAEQSVDFDVKDAK